MDTKERISENNSQFDDNDPDQFRMYRKLFIKERGRLKERIEELERLLSTVQVQYDYYHSIQQQTLKEIEQVLGNDMGKDKDCIIADLQHTVSILKQQNYTLESKLQERIKELENWLEDALLKGK